MPSRLVVCAPSSTTSTFTVQSPATPAPLVDLILICFIVYSTLSGGYWTWAGLVLGGLWGRAKTGTVLEESILAIRGLGLQLATTRGLIFTLPFSSAPPRRIPLSTSRLFLPLSSISDVVINEGISGWQIIYYLVIIQNEAKGAAKLRIGFPELLPRLAEVQKTWVGVRHTLFDELEESETDDDGPTTKDAL